VFIFSTKDRFYFSPKKAARILFHLYHPAPDVFASLRHFALLLKPIAQPFPPATLLAGGAGP